MTRGNCGSGKSTWVRENGLDQYCLDPDTIRLMHQSPVLTINGGYSISQKNDKSVWDTIFTLLQKRMERGEFTVVCGTHNNTSLISRYHKLVEQYRYRCYVVDFSHIDKEQCRQWNQQRESYKIVPDEVIERMDARLANFDPPKWATVVKPDNFWESIERKPINYDKYDRIVVFGDSHSCFDPIQEYFRDNPEREDFLYIHVGDMFDRGPQPEEWARFLLEHFNRKNWIWLQSNHNEHLTKWAFDRAVRSNEFLYNTVPALLKVADKKVWRNVARKFWQCAHFTYGANEYFITHGGLPKMPSPREMPLIASDEFYRGVGKYEQLPEVAQSWDKNSAPHQYQIHGHRSDDETKNLFHISSRSICLDGKVELGNSQKIIELYKSGTQLCISIKNDNIRARFRTDAVENVKPLSNAEFLTSIRSHKGVREQKMGHISSFNFKNKVFYDKSWDNISEMARGLFINNESGEVVARGWKKSFRYNERDETRPDALRDNLIFPCVAYHKYNGFLGLLGYDSKCRELVFCTKSSINNDYSQNFERILRSRHQDKLDEVEQYLANENKCLCFEVIDPVGDPHIIEYDNEHVVLLDSFERSINVETEPYERLVSLGREWGIPVKDRIETLNNWSELVAFIENTEKYRENDIEGYMITDMSGFTLKVKTGFYSQWKRLRGLIQGIARGHKTPYGKLLTPLDNDFISWCIKQDKNKLKNNIIHLRNEFTIR